MVDTVLMLRPTQSATIFLQQLGRGLRRSDDKAVLTVLDFVGLQNEQFRFDLKFRALTGLSRNQLERNVKSGFPFLPPGSQIVFDQVAQDIVLTNIRKQLLRLTTKDLVVDVRQHKVPDVAVRDYSVGTYLREAERSLADIYASSARTFQGEKRAAASWSSLVDWAFPQNEAHLTRKTKRLCAESVPSPMWTTLTAYAPPPSCSLPRRSRWRSRRTCMPRCSSSASGPPGHKESVPASKTFAPDPS